MPMQTVKEAQRIRSPRFERTTPPAFQITERDLDFLEAIGHLEVAQSTHLDVLFPDASDDKLRRRLYAFFHAGLLAHPKGQRAELLTHQGSRALACMLTQAGADLLADRRGFLLTPRNDTLSHGQLRHALEVSDVLVAADAACRQSLFLSFEHFDSILMRAPVETRLQAKPKTWMVELSYRGEHYTFHPTPDGIFAIDTKRRSFGNS